MFLNALFLHSKRKFLKLADRLYPPPPLYRMRDLEAPQSHATLAQLKY